MGRPRESIVKRTHRYLKRIRGTDCWEWQGKKTDLGYGILTVDKKDLRVHRLMWQFYNGPLSKEDFVCHRCDNPSCANPSHLFIGNQLDNMRDAAAKGRVRKGVEHHGAKFTEDDIREILRLKKEGATVLQIAESFSFPYQTIYKIFTRTRWRHVSGF